MNKVDPITVVFSVDENFVQHLGVTLLSLLHNRNTDTTTHIIVIGEGLSSKSKTALRQIAENNNASITLPEVELKAFDLTAISYYPPVFFVLLYKFYNVIIFPSLKRLLNIIIS